MSTRSMGDISQWDWRVTFDPPTAVTGPLMLVTSGAQTISDGSAIHHVRVRCKRVYVDQRHGRRPTSKERARSGIYHMEEFLIMMVS